MTDQPLESDIGGSSEDYQAVHYLSASERSEDWLPPPVRDASVALMLGILGFASCGLLSPLALYFSRRALQEIEESGASHADERNARVGQLMGIVGTALLVIGIALTLAFGIRAWDFLSDLDVPDVR